MQNCTLGRFLQRKIYEWHIQLNLGNEFSTFLFSLPAWHIQLILICNGVLFAGSISVSMILSLMSILVQWPTNCEQESFSQPPGSLKVKIFVSRQVSYMVGLCTKILEFDPFLAELRQF